jgi:DNA modification methylase
VKFCSKEGDIILDPFAGSLPVAKACLNLKRNCICIEIARDIIDRAIKTMNATVEAI